MKNSIDQIWKEYKPFFLFIILMLVFRSSVADWNVVPTGSMKPTIIEGDRIFVNKMAYDIRVPFTHISLYNVSNPSRGDIIVFDSEVSEVKLVKRVVGIPGDLVELNNNVLHINGKVLSYQYLSSTELSTDLSENLLGVEHLIRVSRTGSSRSSFQPLNIPIDHYLVLGDNRDNSADSRVIGFVPRDEIVGRTRKVVVSLDYENNYIPRSDRFLHTL